MRSPYAFDNHPNLAIPSSVPPTMMRRSRTVTSQASNSISVTRNEVDEVPDVWFDVRVVWNDLSVRAYCWLPSGVVFLDLPRRRAHRFRHG